MPLHSKGCKAKAWEVYKCNPNYQLVKIFTYKKNPPTAKKEFSSDWTSYAFLYNNKTFVKPNDTIIIKEFSITNHYDYTKDKVMWYVAITDWELSGGYDYSKLKDIEYKGADYEDDE